MEQVRGFVEADVPARPRFAQHQFRQATQVPPAAVLAIAEHGTGRIRGNGMEHREHGALHGSR